MGAGALDSHPMPRQTSYEAEPQGFRNRRWVFDIMTNSPANRHVVSRAMLTKLIDSSSSPRRIPATFTNPSSDALRHGFRDRLVRAQRSRRRLTVCTGPACRSRGASSHDSVLGCARWESMPADDERSRPARPAELERRAQSATCRGRRRRRLAQLSQLTAGSYGRVRDCIGLTSSRLVHARCSATCSGRGQRSPRLQATLLLSSRTIRPLLRCAGVRPAAADLARHFRTARCRDLAQFLSRRLSGACPRAHVLCSQRRAG